MICRAVQLCFLTTLLVGCATPPEVKEARRAVRDYFDGNYSSAEKRLAPIAKKPDENFVLNNLRLGSVEMVQYDFDDAENSFLNAYEVINSTGTQGGGRSLGAALVDEKIKIWKGEPFERAMANFYLGLIYYIRHDYNNARGAFENSLFKLREYASDKAAKKDNYDEVESNFVIANLMLARCWQKLGRDDLAKANFERVANFRSEFRDLADPDRNAKANLLLVVEFGHGPLKVTNEDGAFVGFAPHPSQAGRIPQPRVLVDGRDLDVGSIGVPPIDLVAMAQERRWQDIDTIRAVKDVVGTGLIAGGAGYGLYRAGTRDQLRPEDLGVAAGLIGAGLLLKATSQADIRQWEMLPRTVFVLPLKVRPGNHELTVSFPNADDLHQTWRNIVVPADGEATYYIRMRRWDSGPFDWPPTKLNAVSDAR